MSYIIKGKELPEKCFYCPCCTDSLYGMDFICMCLKKSFSFLQKGRLKDCPLAALPKQHGRLIDADYLVKVLQDTLDNYPDKCGDNAALEKMIVDVCKQYIEHCPTVIVAENDE